MYIFIYLYIYTYTDMYICMRSFKKKKRVEKEGIYGTKEKRNNRNNRNNNLRERPMGIGVYAGERKHKLSSASHNSSS